MVMDVNSLMASDIIDGDVRFLNVNLINRSYLFTRINKLKGHALKLIHIFVLINISEVKCITIKSHSKITR